MEYEPGGVPIFKPAGEPAAPLSPGKEWHALGSGMNDAVMAIRVSKTLRVSPQICPKPSREVQ